MLTFFLKWYRAADVIVVSEVIYAAADGKQEQGRSRGGIGPVSIYNNVGIGG